MLRVTQPSREQLERKRSSDTHWPNPKRHKHRGTPRTSSCVIVAGGRGGKREVAGRSGSSMGGCCITKCSAMGNIIPSARDCEYPGIPTVWR